MKAYKIFNSDWKCRDVFFEVGKTYIKEGKPILCEYGFHACVNINKCWDYYSFDPKNKVAEVDLIGDIVGDEIDKVCTNKIIIVKELTWEEILRLVNSGHSNSGHSNSGYSNSGDRNSGHRNSGYSNSGHWNSGHWNSGHRNSGAFNVDEPNARLFGKDSGKKLSEISFPQFFYFDITELVCESNMTDDEKTKYPEHVVLGGYLKKYEYKKAWSMAWDRAPKEEHHKVLQLPNFNNKIFLEITGIDVYERLGIKG